MLSKLLVFGAGYVLGTKAGRERYNQIAAMAQAAAKRLDEYGALNQPRSTAWGASRADRRSRGQNKL